MLTSARALTLNSDSGRPLPRVPALADLYLYGCLPRHGQTIMVAGRSGSQKSGFALWLVDQWDLPTLYLSADMSAFTASSRVASTRSGLTTEEVEALMKVDGQEREDLLALLAGSKIQFSFGSPITWRQVDQELDAYVELWDAYPEVIVYDNLMDFDGAESDYAAQMEVFQRIIELGRDTSATQLVLHHASDKGGGNLYLPPGRDGIKNGMSEKPELTLGVGLDPNSLDFGIAVLKQRMGPQDASGRKFTTIRCEPAVTRFHRLGY